MIEAKPLDFAHKVIRDLSITCLSEGGPITQQIFTLLDQKDYLSVASFEFDYNLCDGSYNSIRDFTMARQIQAFFSKQGIFDLGVDKTQAAFNSFFEAEDKCRETNARFRQGSSGNPSVDGVLYISQRKIAAALGDVPSLDTLDLSFGSGATTNVTFDRANIRVKLGSVMQCSASLISGVSALLHQMPPLLDLVSLGGTAIIQVVHGKLSLVPKSYKTLRSIIIEPVLNGIKQRGLGKKIRSRLLLVGVNLRNQTINQKLAKVGSEDGTITTVDVKTASDTLSYGVVLDQIPPPWFDELNSCRTGSYIYVSQHGEKWAPTYLEKFSSMGNGYTFELESLIFWGLASACVDFLGIEDKRISVYGDDIVIPTDAYLLLKDVLEYCGFSVNMEKSFCSGPFRESCGADYLFGNDIRPFYLRDEFNELTLYKMHNFFMRTGEVQLAKAVLRHTRSDLHLFGPDGYGDGHLLGDFLPRSNRSIVRRGFEGFIFDTYTLRPRKFKLPCRGDSILPDYSIYSKHMDSGIPDPFSHDELARHSLDYLSTPVPSDYNDLRGTSGFYKMSLYSTTRGILFN